jgi:hypothetical protein
MESGKEAGLSDIQPKLFSYGGKGKIKIALNLAIG